MLISFDDKKKSQHEMMSGTEYSENMLERGLPDGWLKEATQNNMLAKASDKSHRKRQADFASLEYTLIASV